MTGESKDDTGSVPFLTVDEIFNGEEGVFQRLGIYTLPMAGKSFAFNGI